MTDRIRSAFDSVQAGDGLKQSTKDFLMQRRRGQEQTTGSHPLRKWALAACAALVLVLGLGGYGLVHLPVSYISIDVNPSIELALNCWDRVVFATAFNGDGSTILQTVSVEGLSYTEAVDTIVESEAMRPYLMKEDAALTFTVAADDSDKSESLKTGLDGCQSSQTHSGQIYCAQTDLRECAHHRHLIAALGHNTQHRVAVVLILIDHGLYGSAYGIQFHFVHGFAFCPRKVIIIVIIAKKRGEH